ncbi:hypothetical protein LEMLEM_LOCUS12123 [Lemmus lemmus]
MEADWICKNGSSEEDPVHAFSPQICIAFLQEIPSSSDTHVTPGHQKWNWNYPVGETNPKGATQRHLGEGLVQPVHNEQHQLQNPKE